MNEAQKSLPQGWAKTSISHVVVDKVPQISPPKDLDFVYIDIASIDNETKQIVSPKRIPGEQAPSRARQSIAINDVVVSMTRPNLNAVSIIPTDLAGSIASTGFDVLRPIQIEPSWLFYNVCSQDFVREMGELVRGALYPAIKSTDVRNYQIPIPPLNEQKRIIARMEELQGRSRRAKEALEAIPDLLEQLRQSILAAAFRGDLTKEWREKHPDVEPGSELLKRIRIERRRRWEEAERKKLKTKGLTGDKLGEEFAKRRKKYKEPAPVDTSALPELPGGWYVTSIDEVAFVTKLAGFEYTKYVTYDPDGDLPVIKAENAGKYGFKRTEFSKVRSETIDHLTRSNLRSGDLLMVFVGSVGQVAMVPDDQKYFLGPNIGMIRIQSTYVIPEFAEFFLRSPIGFSLTMSFAKAVTQPSLSMGAIRLIPLFIPPLEEQKIIVEKLKKYNDIIKQSEEKTVLFFKSVQILDQSILTKAFRGELVPQDPNDEPAAILLERIRQEKAREAAQPKSKDKRKAKNHVHAEF
jgi:type I restriction enzyme S subunit